MRRIDVAATGSAKPGSGQIHAPQPRGPLPSTREPVQQRGDPTMILLLWRGEQFSSSGSSDVSFEGRGDASVSDEDSFTRLLLSYISVNSLTCCPDDLTPTSSTPRSRPSAPSSLLRADLFCRMTLSSPRVLLDLSLPQKTRNTGPTCTPPATSRTFLATGPLIRARTPRQVLVVCTGGNSVSNLTHSGLDEL